MRALKAPRITLSDLDSEFLSRYNLAESPPQFNDALRALFLLLPVLSEVAIPAGIPVPWLTELPLKSRFRNALGRYFWPHKLVVREPLKCTELMTIPDIGKNSLHELLCVLESAELQERQAENKTAQTVKELTARIRGRVLLGRAEKRVTSDRDIKEQDATEHGEQLPSARLTTRDTLDNVGKRALSEKHAQEQDATEHGEQLPSARLTTRDTLDNVGKRALSEKHAQEQDETKHDRIRTKDKRSPTVAEMTARILGQVQSGHAGDSATSDRSAQEQDETEHGEPRHTGYLAARGALGQTGNKVTSDKHVSEQDEFEHSGLPRTAYLAAKGALGHAEDRALSKRHSAEQDIAEFGGIQPDSEDLSVSKDVHDSLSNSAFQEAVCETARQAIRAGLLQFDSPDSLSANANEENEGVCSVSALGDLLRHFVTWALAETDAQTIGEAISQSTIRTETPKEWQAIAELSLNHAGFKPEHPYTVLESWVNNLPEMEQHIFSTRVSGLENIPPLQDLGAYFGVTRERVRQLEKRVRRKLSIMLKRESAKPIHWRAKTIRQEIGVAAPFASVERLLSALNGRIDFRRIVLELAGPYDLVNGWLVLSSALGSEPTKKIREMADEIGFIEPLLAAQALKNWGLDQSLHEEWLMRDGKVRLLDGRLVRWDGSIGDKLVIALADIGRPATIEALLEHIEEDRARTSAANALSIDPRAVRISRSEWALASWGLSKYSSIAMSIRNFLKSQEDPTSVEDVVTRLTKDLGLKESSIRAYCQAPMFILENGAIRLRRDDEPYTYDNVSLQNTRGVFALGTHRVSILIEVDGELLRGSGRSLALAAGFLLDIVPNRSLTFNNQDGLSVTLTYPETSISGPSVGSLRSFAHASGARLGDLLTLTFDKSDKSVTTETTDLAQYEPGWQLVSPLDWN